MKSHNIIADNDCCYYKSSTQSQFAMEETERDQLTVAKQAHTKRQLSIRAQETGTKQIDYAATSTSKHQSTSLLSNIGKSLVRSVPNQTSDSVWTSSRSELLVENYQSFPGMYIDYLIDCIGD